MKPGDKQASPTSWMPSESRAPRAGLAVAAPEPTFPLERSSLRGRWRVEARTGDLGSFLTTILGPGSALREVALGGDDFGAWAALVGLRLPERRTGRGAMWLEVAEEAEGFVDRRWAAGEEDWSAA